MKPDWQDFPALWSKLEVVAGKRLAPVGQHSHQAAFGDVRPRLVLEDEGDAEPVQRRLQGHAGVVEHESALDPHPQLAPVLLEIPDVETAIGRHALVDADVTG